MTNIYKGFTRDVGIVAITNIATSFSGMITLPIVSKTLGAYGYGIWGQLVVILNLVGPLITLGLPISLVRYLAAENDNRKVRERFLSVAVLVLALGAVVCLVLLLSAPYIANAFFDGNTRLIRLLAAVLPFQGILVIFSSYFRAFRMMKRWAAFSILEVYGQVGLIAYFILSGYGLEGMAYALLGTKIALCLLATIAIIPRLGLSLPRFSDLKEQLRFGIPTVPNTVASWVVNASDRWVISFFLGATFVGYYLPGYALGELVRMFFFPLSLLLPPTLSKYYDEGNMDAVKVHLAYSLKYFLMLAIPAVFGVSVLSGQILLSLSTPDIAAKGAVITPIIGSGILLNGIHLIYLQIILLIKKTKITAVGWLLAAVVNIILNVILIKIFGIIGAAIATLVAFALLLVVTVGYTSRKIVFPIDGWFLLKSLVSSAVMAGVIRLVDPHGMIFILPMILAGAVIYFCILFLMRGFSKGEMKFFKSLILLR